LIARLTTGPRLVGLLMLLASLALPVHAHAGKDSSEDRPMVLMTGSEHGVYYPVGSALCTLFNFEHPTGSRCVAVRSRGSIANIAALKAGRAQLALVQSDTQAAAYQGSGELEAKGAYPELRSLFALYSEYLAVLVRADSGIQQLGDLKGKRINIGRPESGQHAVVEEVLGAMGLGPRDFLVYRERGPAQLKRLCTGELDAAAFVGGSPNGHVTELALACDVRLLPVAGPQIRQLLEHHPELARGLIPGGRYRGNPHDVPTVSVTATLVTTAAQPEDEVYAFVRTIFDNFQVLAELHPVLNELEPREMVVSHGAAPLHPGAERFFRERGLIEQRKP
jgi:TRAP transporter TAXI family solute receptor